MKNLKRKNGSMLNQEYAKGCFGGSLPGNQKRFKNKKVTSSTGTAGTVGTKLRFKLFSANLRTINTTKKFSGKQWHKMLKRRVYNV